MPTRTKERQLTPAHPIEKRFPITTEVPDHRVRKYRKRVDRGASDLDERQPGWWRHVKIRRLNMRKGIFDQYEGDCGCVGAQLSRYYAPMWPGEEWSTSSRIIGAYDRWMRVLGFHDRMDSRMEIAHGYLASSSDGDGDPGWDLLDQLWANEVRKRRSS